MARKCRDCGKTLHNISELREGLCSNCQFEHGDVWILEDIEKEIWRYKKRDD